MNEQIRNPRAHGITVEPFHGRVTVSFSDAVIASTDRAKVIKEEGYDPVYYIPFEDIYFEFMERTDSSTRSPLKGTASYWRVSAVGQGEADFMWAYETPVPEVSEIAGHGAFDPKKAEIIAEPVQDKVHTPHMIE